MAEADGASGPTGHTLYIRNLNEKSRKLGACTYYYCCSGRAGASRARVSATRAAALRRAEEGAYRHLQAVRQRH